MDPKDLAHELRAQHPTGLIGEREGLVTLLVGKGFSHPEAVRLARTLEEQGYAHFLPGARNRWVFTSKPVDLRGLMRALDQEYKEFVGEGDEEEEAVLSWPPAWRGTGRWPGKCWRPCAWRGTWRGATAPNWTATASSSTSPRPCASSASP